MVWPHPGEQKKNYVPETTVVLEFYKRRTEARNIHRMVQAWLINIFGIGWHCDKE